MRIISKSFEVSARKVTQSLKQVLTKIVINTNLGRFGSYFLKKKMQKI